ncbi:MAG: penicillin-binding protein 2 [Bacilli bacterium]
MKRIKIYYFLIIITFIYILSNLYYIQIIKNKKYIEKHEKESTKIIYGETAPRGRILDRNGKILVDNKPVKVIYYKKEIGVTIEEEIKIAKKVSELIDLNTIACTEKNLKDYWLVSNDSKKLITKNEIEKYKNRQLSEEDIYNLKLKRIKDTSTINKEEAYIYYLMNKGYKYEEKIIKENATIYEYAIIAENMNQIKGYNVKLSWERIYNYGNTLKTIFGNVGMITKENKEVYIKNGHMNTDIVGKSYLEYQYDKYLTGKRNKYSLKNNVYTLIEEGEKGNDIYLSIDIDLQQKTEEIIKRNLTRAKEEPNTEYLNKSHVIITDPKTGQIKTFASITLIDNKFYDNTASLITSSVTVGSTVKAASHIVGYNNGGLRIGEVREDSCIKIKSTPEKCSFRYLGVLNDISALKYSSNTFQFHTAIKVGKGYYSYDNPLSLDLNAFKLYRETFKEFGLGLKTEIDLPNEKIGFIGKSDVAGHLLDLAIGQYDTYTPIELSQYVSTIANKGERLKPFLVMYIKDNKNNNIIENKPSIINKITTEPIYFSRTLEGLREVLTPGGTGYYYIEPTFNPAGKTGTSQSFIDSNKDGKIDTETISSSFVGYAPYYDPTVTFTVINPDIAVINNNEYTSFITKRITKEVSDIYFNMYNK